MNNELDPLISIIIPLYNKEKFIRQSVISILSQSYYNIETIIVDDGSTDKSLDQVKDFDDDRLKIVSKANGGPSSARNYGIMLAKGDFIYFIDADDTIEKSTLSNFVNLVKAHPTVDIFVANYYMKKGNLFKKHSIYIHEGIVKNNFRSWFWETLSPCQGAVFYKKSVLEKYMYPEHLKRWEDACMFFEVMKNEKIYLSNFPAFIYHLNNSSASFGRSDIREDFLGYIKINNIPFWEKMSFRLLYSQALRLYPSQSKKLYGKAPYGFMFNGTYYLFALIKIGLRIVSKVVNTIAYYRK